MKAKVTGLKNSGPLAARKVGYAAAMWLGTAVHALRFA
jgi:hypothetical protein